MTAFLRSQQTVTAWCLVTYVVSTKVCSHGKDKISGALTDEYVEIANDSDSNRPIDFIPKSSP